MAKRGQNTGSVSQRKDGRWEARFTLPDGRRRSLYAPTRAAVEDKLTEALADLKAGILAESGRMTVADLGTEFLAAIDGQLRRTTVDGHRSRWKNHITPVIGTVPLRSITGAHVQRVLTEARRRKLAPGTVRAVYHSMSAAFREAVAWGLLSRNPASGVSAPIAENRELPIESEAQVDALVSELQRDEAFRAAFLLALGCGLRRGEIRGLRWRDVDLHARAIHVRHNVEIVDGAVRFVPLKSAAGARSLPLPGFVADTLRTHRASQNATRLRRGAAWQDHDLVVTTHTGRPYEKITLTRHLESCCARAGVERLTLHHLRHLCATLLAMRGVSPKVIQAILGHATSDLSLRVYTHVLQSSLTSAADAMDDALKGFGGSSG